MAAQQRGPMRIKEGLSRRLLLGSLQTSGSALPTDSGPPCKISPAKQCDSLANLHLSCQDNVKHSEPQKMEMTGEEAGEHFEGFDVRARQPVPSVQSLLPEGCGGDCEQVLNKAKSWHGQTLDAHPVAQAGCTTRVIPDYGEYTGMGLDQQWPQEVMRAGWDTEVLSHPDTVVTQYRPGSRFGGLTSEDTSDDPVKSTDTTNDPVKSTGDTIYQYAVYCILLFLCVCVHGAVGTTLRSPGQNVSLRCLEWMNSHYNDTPSVLHHDFLKDYLEVNATCCGDFPGTDFHGQMDYDESGDQYSMIACVVTKVVPKGYSGRIENYGSDKPYFHVLMDKESSYRDPKERHSWQVSYPYHYGAEKSRCDGVGREMYCRGTDGDDNRCTCQQGYKPSAGCEGTLFSSNTPHCHCEKCPAGLEAWRSPVSTNKAACKDVLGLPLFECRLQSSPPPPQPPSSRPRGSSVSPGSPEISNVSGPPGEDPNSPIMFRLGYLLRVFGIFFLFIFIPYHIDKIGRYIRNKFNSLRSHMGYKQDPQPV